MARERYTGHVIGVRALRKFAENPEVWRAPLRNELIQSGADQDTQIIEISRELINLLNPIQESAYRQLESLLKRYKDEYNQIKVLREKYYFRFFLFLLLVFISSGLAVLLISIYPNNTSIIITIIVPILTIISAIASIFYANYAFKILNSRREETKDFIQLLDAEKY